MRRMHGCRPLLNFSLERTSQYTASVIGKQTLVLRQWYKHLELEDEIKFDNSDGIIQKHKYKIKHSRPPRSINLRIAISKFSIAI